MNSIRRINEKTIKVALTTFVYKEGENFVCIAPSIDLAGHGLTKDNAIESFIAVLDDFIGYSLENKMLAKNLFRLGWNFEADERQSDLDERSNFSKDNFQSKPIDNEFVVQQVERELAIA